MNTKIIYEANCTIDVSDNELQASYMLVTTHEKTRNCFSVLCLLHDGDSTETKFVYDVACSESEGIALVDAMCRCKVVPYSADETVYEYISAKYSVL